MATVKKEYPMQSPIVNVTRFLIILLIASLPLLAGGQPEMINPATLDGELVYAEGDVLINGATVEIGDAIKPGDRIKTGADGVAEIAFGPRNIIQFLENTDAEINPAWSGLAVENGTVAAVLNGLDRLGFDASNQFQVRTSTAVMGVRGTSFFISNPEENQAYFCTCHGKLHIEGIDGLVEEDTEAYHHAAVWYIRTPDGIQAFPSGLHYHDDDTLNDIAAKVNTRVLWRDSRGFSL
jgi:hypothetical protein